MIQKKNFDNFESEEDGYESGIEIDKKPMLIIKAKDKKQISNNEFSHKYDQN